MKTEAKISLHQYLDTDKTISPRNSFSFKKTYHGEENRTYEEWVSFFQDK